MISSGRSADIHGFVISASAAVIVSCQLWTIGGACRLIDHARDTEDLGEKLQSLKYCYSLKSFGEVAGLQLVILLNACERSVPTCRCAPLPAKVARLPCTRVGVLPTCYINTGKHIHLQAGICSSSPCLYVHSDGYALPRLPLLTMRTSPHRRVLTSGHSHILIDNQAYHSAYNDDPQYTVVGNMAILPVNTRIRGPAPTAGEKAGPSLSRVCRLLTSITLYTRGPFSTRHNRRSYHTLPT